jgi:hypothetical protein
MLNHARPRRRPCGALATLTIHLIQQRFIRINRRSLFVGIKVARHHFRLGTFDRQPVQQRDQNPPAPRGDTASPLDPGANLARRARQRLASPRRQLALLLVAQAAEPVFIAKALQTLDPAGCPVSCEAITRVLLLDDDSIRTWLRLYLEAGDQPQSRSRARAVSTRMSQAPARRATSFRTNRPPPERYGKPC